MPDHGTKSTVPGLLVGLASSGSCGAAGKAADVAA
jgi:hypothetical protein